MLVQRSVIQTVACQEGDAVAVIIETLARAAQVAEFVAVGGHGKSGRVGGGAALAGKRTAQGVPQAPAGGLRGDDVDKEDEDPLQGEDEGGGVVQAEADFGGTNESVDAVDTGGDLSGVCKSVCRSRRLGGEGYAYPYDEEREIVEHGGPRVEPGVRVLLVFSNQSCNFRNAEDVARRLCWSWRCLNNGRVLLISRVCRSVTLPVIGIIYSGGVRDEGFSGLAGDNNFAGVEVFDEWIQNPSQKVAFLPDLAPGRNIDAQSNE